MMSKTASERNDRLEDSDPESPRFPDHIRKNPDALVGLNLIANAVKRGYNPDGYEHLNAISERSIRDSNEEGTIFTYETVERIGKVAEYDPDTDSYTVVLRDVEIQQETGEWPNETDIVTVEQSIPAGAVRSKLKDGYRQHKDGGWIVE